MRIDCFFKCVKGMTKGSRKNYTIIFVVHGVQVNLSVTLPPSASKVPLPYLKTSSPMDIKFNVIECIRTVGNKIDAAV